MSIIPNIPPRIFSSSAVILGYLLIDDMSANEQNALGNWLMLTAQVLCTNAYYKQLQDERNKNKYSENKEKINEVDMLKKIKKAIEKELETLEEKV